MFKIRRSGRTPFDSTISEPSPQWRAATGERPARVAAFCRSQTLGLGQDRKWNTCGLKHLGRKAHGPRALKKKGNRTKVAGQKNRDKRKERRTFVRRSRLYSPRVLAESNPNYWLSGLKTRMPASVREQTPAGSTRTTASSSAQKPRIPVWLMVFGTAFTV